MMQSLWHIKGSLRKLVVLVRVMDFTLPAVSPLGQVTLLVSQHKDHSRRGYNAAAAITLSPLTAEEKTVRGKANTDFAVPY